MSVTSKINGYFVYTVQELSSTNATVTGQSYSALSSYLSTGKTTIHSQDDYVSYIHNTPRNMFVGNLSVSAISTSTTIRLSNYFPSTIYNFCGYFQNAANNISTVNCTNITTPSN